MSNDFKVLIHIGFHKTASTWLQKKIFTPEYGFIQPVDMHEVPPIIVCPPCSDYSPEGARKSILAGYYSKPQEHGSLVPVISHERLSGDPWTGGRDARTVAKRLKETFTNGKVLMVIRDQVPMIVSLYKTYVVLGGKASLNDFLFPPNNEEQLWFSPSMYKYDSFVEYYIDLFGVDNVKVMNFDDLKRSSDDFVREITEFSGASGGQVVGLGTVNAGLSDLSVKTLRLINIMFGFLEVYPLSINRGRIWWFFRARVYNLDFFLKRIFKKKTFRATVSKAFGSYYVDSNKKLCKLLGRDFFVSK